MAKVGYIYDERMLLHEGYEQYENPSRILAIHDKLKQLGYLEKLISLDTKIADKQDLQLAHSSEYIDRMYDIFTNDERRIKLILNNNFNSMFGNKDSLTTARVAAGGALSLMKAILEGKVYHGIANIRSPGHHAYINKASGFCFFNNVAIAARYANKHGKRVAIVDWDIHSGDGTLDILGPDPNTLVINICRYDNARYYPGKLLPSETDTQLSIPLNGIAYDEHYYSIFDEKVIPKLTSYKPDIIIVSAGYDAAAGDPLGGYKLTPECYYTMTKLLLGFGKPVMLVLEGGYNLDSLSKSMGECARALLE